MGQGQSGEMKFRKVELTFCANRWLYSKAYQVGACGLHVADQCWVHKQNSARFINRRLWV